METETAELTEMQKSIVATISAMPRNPTYAELAAKMGLCVRSVQHQLDRLEDMGVLSRNRHESGHVIPRTIKIH